jgi:hypothetical protein
MPVAYFNSGCWTETPPAYLTILRGNVETRTYGKYTPSSLAPEALVGMASPLGLVLRPAVAVRDDRFIQAQINTK